MNCGICQSETVRGLCAVCGQSVPDPIAHARVLVEESFSGDVEAVIQCANLNVQADPDHARYWHDVAVAARFWSEQMRRAQA